jgi:small subunit ribosomal protein S16
MLKIRLQRVGRINSPAYRIVVTEHARAAKKGLLEKLGTYNPKTKERNVNADRIKYWISVGAKPSDTMHNMLVSLGIITGKKINVLPKFVEPVKEEVAEAAPAPAAAEDVGGAVTEATPETAIEDAVESASPEAREEAVEVEAEAKQ